MDRESRLCAVRPSGDWATQGTLLVRCSSFCPMRHRSSLVRFWSLTVEPPAESDPMFDAQVITPLRPEEIAELSEFLAAGFGRAADDAYASPEVLNWKYFDPCGAQEQPRSFIARDRGTIVAHLGVCPRAFVSVGFGSEGTPIRTVHFVDWLASRTHPSTGLMLMMRGF